MDEKICYKEAGKRIKEKREALGLTLEQVGNALGIHKSTVKRYEDGVTRKITIAAYEKLAEVLQTTPLYLMEGTEEESEEKNFLKPMEVTYYAIPILGKIRAGTPIEASKDILGHTYIDRKDFENYFALRVEGDSMDLANIKDGSVVVISRQNYIENGDIGVVLIDNNDATVKRIFINGDVATLVPQSSNPANQPIVVDLKKQNFEILGRVVKIEYYR